MKKYVYLTDVENTYITNQIYLQYPNVEDDYKLVSQLETAKPTSFWHTDNTHSNNIFCFLFMLA